jgi:hypothetical protein
LNAIAVTAFSIPSGVGAAATTGGDINELMELLAPDVTLWTDGGGKVRHAMRPIVGVDGRIVTIHNVANPEKLLGIAGGVRKV